MRKNMSVRGRVLRKAVKIYALSLCITLGVYLVFALLDPGLLSYDLRQKFHALADDTIAVTAIVLDPPVTPVVTATAECDESTGSLRVDLDWADDVNTYTYDIDRDGTPLVTGLASSLYSDTNVVLATTYEYEVTGNGPMGPGSATSLPVSVTTPEECEITAPTPAVTIVSLAGKNVDAYRGTPQVESRRPVFSGTTNMSGATILITLGTSFIVEITANSNGYWEWKPSASVAYGSHVLTVVATDQSDSTRQATASLRFKIVKADESEDKKKGKSDSVEAGVVGVAQASIPLQFTLTGDESVLQGETLHTKIVIDEILERYTNITVPIRYSVMDENGVAVLTETRSAYLVREGIITDTLVLPLYVLSGEYTLLAEVFLDGTNISRSVAFRVVELPLLQLSSGAVISYADVILHLGWIVALFLCAFFFWGFLFLRELVMYLQSDGEVTEYDLKRAGYIRK